MDVSVLSVEHFHGASKRSYVDFMKQQGYNLHKDIHFLSKPLFLFVDDLIFVKQRWHMAD